MVRACGAIVGARHASPAPCAAHTYCDYSRHCCHWCAEHTNYRCCDYSFSNIIVGYCGRGIISITRIYSAGEACLAPTKPCGSKAINTIYYSYKPHTNYRCCDYSFQNIIVGYCGARHASPLQNCRTVTCAKCLPVEQQYTTMGRLHGFRSRQGGCLYCLVLLLSHSRGLLLLLRWWGQGLRVERVHGHRDSL